MKPGPNTSHGLPLDPLANMCFVDILEYPLLLHNWNQGVTPLALLLLCHKTISKHLSHLFIWQGLSCCILPLGKKGLNQPMFVIFGRLKGVISSLMSSTDVKIPFWSLCSTLHRSLSNETSSAWLSLHLTNPQGTTLIGHHCKDTYKRDTPNGGQSPWFVPL